MKSFFLRALVALAVLPVLSCGGGGGDGAGAGAAASGSAVEWGFGATLAGAHAQGGGDGGAGSSGSGAAGTSGGDTGSSASASAGDSAGVGSGGTGASASAGDSGDSGVGGVGGVGSIIVNGVRYETGGAVLKLRDVPLLQLGMTVKVNGPTNAEFTAGTATEVESAVDLRGVVEAVDVGNGRFTVLGSTVVTDSATVWGNLAGLSSLAPGATVQVWGQPADPGVLRATRIEQRGAATPILTGTLQSLDAATHSFHLGGLTVDYGSASLPAGLVPGANVRVRAAVLPVGGRLAGASVEPWYPVSLAQGARRQLGGVVTDFAGASRFRVLGIPVDASAATVLGGGASGSLAALANGAEVEVAGTVSDGTLVATKLRIKKVPGGVNTSVFELFGPVGAFRSLADFKVKGQQVDASAPDVRFINGTPADLRNGNKVSITGGRIVNDVLIATQVVFD